MAAFQATLRYELGDSYLISHAPLGPWFDDQSYSDGAYYTVNKEVGSTIDWYNVQYYNQHDAYNDCGSLIHNSSSTQWPATSILELNSTRGVDLSKLVLGKPIEASEVVSGGFMNMSDLATCVAEGKKAGWSGSLMFWEWETDLVSGATLRLSKSFESLTGFRTPPTCSPRPCPGKLRDHHVVHTVTPRCLKRPAMEPCLPRIRFPHRYNNSLYYALDASLRTVVPPWQ